MAAHTLTSSHSFIHCWAHSFVRRHARVHVYKFFCSNNSIGSVCDVLSLSSKVCVRLVQSSPVPYHPKSIKSRGSSSVTIERTKVKSQSVSHTPTDRRMNSFNSKAKRQRMPCHHYLGKLVESVSPALFRDGVDDSSEPLIWWMDYFILRNVFFF